MSMFAVLALSVVLADRPVIPGADQAAYKAWLADQAVDAETSFSLKPRCADAQVRDVATQVVTIRNPPSGQRSQALVESVSVEGCGRKTRINVNVVAPTFVRTQQVQHMLSDASFYGALVARIPLGRIAEPEDVRNAVLFFVSSAADFITGQTLYLDGGITATQ